MIIFFILDLGRAVYYYSTMQNAVREGARYGIINPNDKVNIDKTFRYLIVGMEIDPYPNQPEIAYYDEEDFYDVGGIKVIPTPTPHPTYNSSEDELIVVCTEYQFTAITPFVQAALGSQTIPMNTCSSMRLEK
jgi:hypothetical protein